MRRALSSVVVMMIWSLALASAQNQYTVDRIVDGDTVVLSGLGTVRLIGVDAPEVGAPRPAVDQFAKEARAFLVGYLSGKAVRVEFDQTRNDRFGRTLAYLYLADGTFVNREIVRLGYGHMYDEFPFRFLDSFRLAQQDARTASRGLWATDLGGMTTAGLGSATPAARPAPILSSRQTDGATTSNGRLTVFVGATGSKYHLATCRTLTRTKTPVVLREIAATRGPCGVCNPPTLSGQ